jgi:hypothetical protein
VTVRNNKAGWITPLKMGDLRETVQNRGAIWPPAASTYLVTHRDWQDTPDKARALYVGISTQMKIRLGALLNDMFGFYDAKNKRHPGGRALHQWTKNNKVSPLDLHLAWSEDHDCHECLEQYWYERLAPECNKMKPRCTVHGRDK